jgi:glucose-6-phosphate 1-dehydrogenase
MDAYERILGYAMAGDAKIFAREGYGEEARRIVDPILKASAPVLEYDKGAWGPVRPRRAFFHMDARIALPKRTRMIFALPWNLPDEAVS